MSSEKDQRARGQIDVSDIEGAKNLTLIEAMKLLGDKKAHKRTLGVVKSREFYIKNNTIDNEDYINALLYMLKHEKALYTRLAISKNLEICGENSIKLMYPYLSQIGNNQYTSLPELISKKRRYPLPRDLIARVFGFMDGKNIEKIIDCLEIDDEHRISELIDGIGYNLYDNFEYATLENFKKVVFIPEKYANNKIIIWKFVTFMSAFKLDESLEILHQLKSTYNEGLISLEIKRSENFILGKTF